jgi:hypothetical protein
MELWNGGRLDFPHIPLFHYPSLYLLNIAVYMPKGRLYIAALK